MKEIKEPINIDAIKMKLYKEVNSEKSYWKWATLLITILAIIPSYYAIYNNQQVSKYKTELDQLKETHKSFVDSIYSITYPKDSVCF